jgi:hypothetical protein
MFIYYIYYIYNTIKLWIHNPIKIQDKFYSIEYTKYNNYEDIY